LRKSMIVFAVITVCALLLTVNISLAKQKYYGTIEKMPASGMVGEWVISGKAVQVTKDTKLKQDHGPLQVGAYVEVEGLEYEGKFIATEIETEKKK
jgi:hypothetical protein